MFLKTIARALLLCFAVALIGLALIYGYLGVVAGLVSR